jgi:hypothetical protein
VSGWYLHFFFGIYKILVVHQHFSVIINHNNFELFYLLGVASVINHTSELFAYFFLHELIHRLGHIKILFLGLLGNFVRFVYISIITNPWWVLPFEFIQGLTHAAVWATACSYLSQAAPENLRISCQGVLQGFHFGFGRGCGALFGGFFASYFGRFLLKIN